MFIAVSLVVIVVVSMIIADKIGMPLQKRHELFVLMNSVAAFIAFGVVALWVVIGPLRGQHPSFSLWPLVVIGLIFTFSGLHANKVYKDLYGNTPASS